MAQENKEKEPEDRIGINVEQTITGMLKHPEIIKDSLSKYAKCTIDVANDEDTSKVWQSMTENEKFALKELVKATAIMDELFSIQSTGKPLSEWQSVGKNLSKDSNDICDFLRINIGPWDRLTIENSNKMGVATHPKTVNFYPSDMLGEMKDGDDDDSAKEKFDKLLESEYGNNQSDIELANGYFSVISKSSDKNDKNKIKIVPYNVEYSKYVTKASEYLKNAANLLSKDDNGNHKELISFLLKRSENFLNDKYGESDELWIQCNDSIFDITIGPYEVYEDGLLCKKACFESFLCLKDIESSNDLQTFRKYLQLLENNLPNINNEKYSKWVRNENVKPNYIVAVNQIGRGGDCAGPQTAAFNLPNDENVTKKYGNKLVILKNIQKLKFKYVLCEISKVAIVKEQEKYVKFDSFFTHILCHEMCHSLGPHSIILANGKETTVRNELTSNHSSIEEAKADIAGLWSLIYLMIQGSSKNKNDNNNKDDRPFPNAKMTDVISVLVTFLASAFRSIRFGVHEAHGKGQVIQMNHILENKGFGIVGNGKNVQFKVNFDNEKELFEKLSQNENMEIDEKYIKTVYSAIADCANCILSIQGSGDSKKAQTLIDNYAKPNDATLTILDLLKTQGIPVDIYPSYKYP